MSNSTPTPPAPLNLQEDFPSSYNHRCRCVRRVEREISPIKSEMASTQERKERRKEGVGTRRQLILQPRPSFQSLAGRGWLLQTSGGSYFPCQASRDSAVVIFVCHTVEGGRGLFAARAGRHPHPHSCHRDRRNACCVLPFSGVAGIDTESRGGTVPVEV